MIELQDIVLAPWGMSSISAVAELVFCEFAWQPMHNKVIKFSWRLQYFSISVFRLLGLTASLLAGWAKEAPGPGQS